MFYHCTVLCFCVLLYCIAWFLCFIVCYCMAAYQSVVLCFCNLCYCVVLSVFVCYSMVLWFMLYHAIGSYCRLLYFLCFMLYHAIVCYCILCVLWCIMLLCGNSVSTIGPDQIFHWKSSKSCLPRTVANTKPKYIIRSWAGESLSVLMLTWK